MRLFLSSVARILSRSDRLAGSSARFVLFLLRARAILVLALLMVLFTALTPDFLTVNNFSILSKHVAIFAILAIGMTFTVLTAGIDLSVGSVAGLGGIIAGYVITQGFPFHGATYYPDLVVAILVSLAVCVAVGAVNGWLVSKAGVAPFIATLGTLYIARGTALLISGGKTFPDLAGQASRGNTGFPALGQGFLLHVPVPVWITLLLFVFAAVVASKTPFGRHVYAVGGNERASRLAGIRVPRVQFLTYLFSAFCAALVGLIIASELEAAHPATGEGFELDAIAAVVLGGTSLMGGRGSVTGSLIGACGDRCARRWLGDARRLGILADGDQRPGDCPCRCRRSTTVSPAGEALAISPSLPARGGLMLRRSKLFVIGMAALLLSGGCHRRDLRRPLIAIIVPSQDNPFFKAEADAAAARARLLGYRVRVDSHDDDAYRQDNLIDAAIASNAAAIILDNAGTDASISAVRRATKAGIPCFLIDRDIAAGGIAKAQIIADNDQGARIVAQAFAHSLEPKGGDYAELLGIESDTNAQVRTRGFHAVLDGSPNLKLVSAQSANWSQSEAFQKTETILQAHAQIAGILAGNDTMAVGAVAAVRAAGRSDIVIAGFDGSPDALAAIRSGELLATSLQPAHLIARLAVDEADRFLHTGSTGQPERQIIPCDLVTKANVDEFANFEKIR